MIDQTKLAATLKDLTDAGNAFSQAVATANQTASDAATADAAATTAAVAQDTAHQGFDSALANAEALFGPSATSPAAPSTPVTAVA